ncbi:GTP cyclohydrolase I FolE [Microvirga sp. W0021]|uniref:GTP cyclohydrolase 1 n=1 Tax=Hohaiivirga grylli TaxID=3133970 RepID=A0ABV0BKP8_9HYPH
MEERQKAISVIAPAVKRPTREEAEAAVEVLIRWAGDNPEREGLRETPQRVARAYLDIFSGNFKSPADDLDATFPKEADYGEIVLISDIQFYSHCEHHLVPFFGKAHVGYIPSEKILGLSRIAKLVRTFAHRLQTQERLTAEIAEELQKGMNAKGVAVIMEAEHLCMSMRGIRQPGTQTLTAHFTGVFKDEPIRQSQFISLIRQNEK